MQNTIDKKELLKGILVIGLYFILPSIINLPFLFFDSLKNSYSFRYLFVYFILSVFFIILYYKDLKLYFIDMKKNYKSHLSVTFKYWLKGFFIMYVSSIIITLLGISENLNQQQNMDLFKQYPLTEFILACLFAPIIEELVFRRSLYKAINNKHIYAFTTGIIFGFLHVFTSLADLRTLIYLIPYSSLGIAFGYAYKETNNIFSTMIVHATHNFLVLSITILLGGLI